MRNIRRRRLGDSSLDVITFKVPIRRSPVMIPGDRRVYHPAGREMRPAVSFSRRDQTRLVIARRKARPGGAVERESLVEPYFKVGFAVPRKVGICVRRKQRKEVLHALRIAGSGGIRRDRRRNDWSDVVC